MELQEAICFCLSGFQSTGFKHISGQITIIPKPELRGFWGGSLTKPPFGVSSAEVAIICQIFTIRFKKPRYLAILLVNFSGMVIQSDPLKWLLVTSK